MRKILTLFILIGVVAGFTACGSDNGNRTYSITFHANGGTGTMAAITGIAEGDPVALPANTFERADHIFEGWSLTASGAVARLDEAQFTMGTASLNLYAVWTPRYTITFDANGGTGTTASQSFGEGYTEVLTMNAFTRENYRFMGWATTSGGNAEYEDGAAFTMPTTGNLTLYAVWELIPTYTITFNANGGTGTMTALTVQENTSVTLPASTFTRGGHNFIGWSLAEDGDVDYSDGVQFTIEEENVILYAVWLDVSIPLHDIIFNANGGTGNMASQRVAEGSTVALSSNAFIAPTGQRFKGWSITAGVAVGGAIDYANAAQFQIGTANVTLYAVWELIPTYTITFNGNNSTAGSMQPLTVEENTRVALTANAFTRQDHRFAGWAESSNGPIVYLNQQQFQVGTENVELFAVWTHVNSVAIIFFANGGTGAMLSQTIDINGTATLNSNTFTREGHTFAGWAYEPFGGIAYLNAADITVQNANISLYAIWAGGISAVRYLVTFDMNGGIGEVPNAPFAFEIGEEMRDVHIGDIDNISMSGFYFWGFWDALTGGQRYYRYMNSYPNDYWLERGREGDPENWDRAEPVTLYARWSTERPPWWFAD